MKVIVGSKNPVKINAAKRAFSKFFDDFEVLGIDAESGVSNMPMTRQETKKGAINRAKKALEHGADFAVGIEGGVYEDEHGMFLFGVIAILDKENKLSLAGSEGFMLPEKISAEIRNGKELGPLMDKITGMKNIKQNNGAIGYFTKNHVTRTTSFEQSIILALVRFVNKEIYEER
jgi:inosine/xanthosine triphosphatase